MQFFSKYASIVTIIANDNAGIFSKNAWQTLLR